MFRDLRSEFLVVAAQILAKQGRDMSPREIVQLAFDQGLFSENVAGRTPHQTMKAKLSVHVRRYGDSSPFVRTRPGRYNLRAHVSPGDAFYGRPPIAPPRSSESALVFPSRWLDQYGRFQGISRDVDHFVKSLVSARVVTYMQRLDAEMADDYKQVLTYVLCVRGDDQILAFQRGTYNRTEAYLRGSQCVGFGGHVTEGDRTFFNDADLGIGDNAMRELLEELRFSKDEISRLRRGQALTPIGVLNDDSSETGRRHIAIVYRYDLAQQTDPASITRGEKSIAKLRALNLGSDALQLWRFEYWSQLCLREYFADVVRALPAFRVRRRARLRPPHLLAVVGPLGSGKSEVTHVLKQDFGYAEINSGRVLAGLLGIPPVPTTPRDEFQRRAFEFIAAPAGPATLARALLNEANASKNDRVLVDGIRQLATLDELRKQGDDRRFGLIYVHTAPDLAYQFYRLRENSSITIQEFLALRSAPVETEVESFIGKADAVLYNWTGLFEFRNVIRAMMSGPDPLEEES